MPLTIIDPETVKWEVPNVLYRGNTQSKFEQRIITSFVNGKPTYYGIVDVHDKTRKLTFVQPFSCDMFVSAAYRTTMHGSLSLTNYPLLMAIKADNYLDKLRVSDKGEGLIIEGEIDADDITVLFSSENRVLNRPGMYNPEYFPQQFSELLRKILKKGLDTQSSLLKRFYEGDRQTRADLNVLCFGRRSYPYTPKEQQKVVQAMQYLEDKLRGN